MSTNQESFADLLSVYDVKLTPGSIIEATVVSVDGGRVVVNAGLKSEAFIDAAEFKNEEVQVGDEVEVYIESLENGYGESVLSREKAKRAVIWQKLEKIHEDRVTVTGVITEKVKGGFVVEVEGVTAFLPGSLIDLKPVRDTSYLEGKDLPFKVIKMDKKRNNIVVSRRAVMEEESDAERSARIEELEEGQEIAGIVKNITDYGAFVDLGGADGLLHITDMSWKRIKHPSEVLKVGDEINVKILKFDREKNRVSLGIKQLGEDPWLNIARRYPTGTRLYGKVSNVTDYGCFVELEDGVEGLVHMSEMDWTNKNVHPSKVVQLGQEVEVMVLEINEERRRISLGLKQCVPNPWDEFSQQHKEGDKVKGNIRSITDFGVFVGLDGDIDGLIHLSDISWTEDGETAVRQFKKGDEVEAVILSIDAERERISLGIKQLTADPLADYLNSIDTSAIITGKVTEVDAKGAVIELADGIFGHMKVSDYSFDKVADLTTELKVGDELNVKITNAERRGSQLPVSHKATLRDSVKKLKDAEVSTRATLGDLLKEQMGDK